MCPTQALLDSWRQRLAAANPHLNWAPTLLQVAGAKPDPAYPMEGMSLLPVLSDPALQVARNLYWRMNYRKQRALRSCDWKYLAIEDRQYLLNLAVDERERTHPALRESERLQAMRRQYEEWEQTVRPASSEARSELVYSDQDMPSR